MPTPQASVVGPRSPSLATCHSESLCDARPCSARVSRWPGDLLVKAAPPRAHTAACLGCHCSSRPPRPRRVCLSASLFTREDRPGSGERLDSSSQPPAQTCEDRCSAWRLQTLHSPPGSQDSPRPPSQSLVSPDDSQGWARWILALTGPSPAGIPGVSLWAQCARVSHVRLTPLCPV